MSARTVKSVSFRPADDELLKHANKQPDFSNYVKRLIAQDRNGETNRLMALLIELLERLERVPPAPAPSQPAADRKGEEVDAKAVDGLLL